MNKLLPFLTLFITINFSLSAQVIVSDSLMASYSTSELSTLGAIAPTNGADVYRLIYNTIDAQGNPTIASGAMLVPHITDCNFPIVNYHHGTIHEKEEVPSRFSPEIAIGYNFAGIGFLTILPDYLGLGDSPGFHPYVHAKSEASASIDMIRAAKEFAASNGISLNNQLFLTGYSQGGHSTMATHKEIEEFHSAEFTVTANAPLSGPHDVSGIMTDILLDTVVYGSPDYLPYIIFGYQEAYGDIFDSVQQIFKSPYDMTVPPLMDGYHAGWEISAAMTAIPNQSLNPVYHNLFLTDPNFRLRQALRDNDLYRWSPVAPIKMWYCEADELVPYENSIIARDSLMARGGVSVEAFSAGAGNSHGDCVAPALISARNWFLTLKNACDQAPVGINSVDVKSVIKVFPNPVKNGDNIIVEAVIGNNATYTLYNVQGKTTLSGILNDDKTAISTKNLSSGVYFLSVLAENINETRKIIVK